MRVLRSCRLITGIVLAAACLAAGIGAILLAYQRPERGEEKRAAAAAVPKGEGFAPRRGVLEHEKRLASLNRLSGTEGCGKAAEYIERNLRQWGLDVRTQEFSVVIPVTKEMDFRVDGREYALHPLWPNWTRTCTTTGILSGPLVYAGGGKLKNYRGLPMSGADFAGGVKPIVMLDGDKGLDWFSAAMLGAQAIIFCESEATTRVEMENKVSLLPANIPRFYCEEQTAERLKRLAGEMQQKRDAEEDAEKKAALAGLPRVELRCRVDWEERKTRNIVALLEGTDPARRQAVMFQAFYDSAGTVPDVSYGAESACGAAALLETARELSRRPPAQSAAFAFLSGHFESMQGAKSLFGAIRKTHGEWLEAARKLEEQVLATSALEGRTFWDTWQVRVGILIFVLGAGFGIAWLATRKENWFWGTAACAAGVLAMGVWGSVALMLEDEGGTGEGVLRLPKLEEVRLASLPLEEAAPEAYGRIVGILRGPDECIAAVRDARMAYEEICAERVEAEAAGGELKQRAKEAVEVLHERAGRACATLTAYDEISSALRGVPEKAAEKAAAVGRAVESLVAADASAARLLCSYLQAIESLAALEELGLDLPERIGLVVSLDLSSKADTLALLFKGSYIEQHEKNYETTLIRCMSPTADIACSIGDALSPGTLVNCVINPRGLHWTNYTGGDIATDNEIAMLAGFPSCCLASAHDARDLLDTPLDTYENLDLERLVRQASFIIEWAGRFAEDGRTAVNLATLKDEQLLSKERFRNITARTVEYDMSRGMGVADKPVSGALMACFHDPGYYMRHKLQKMLWGVREVEMRFADQRGYAIFTGIPDTLARYWNDKWYTVEAYCFDAVTGGIAMAPDLGEQGAKKFNPRLEPKKEDEFLTCVIFPCVDVSVFDTLDQRSYYMFTYVEVFDAETDAEPFRYGYRLTGRVGYNKSYIEPCAVLFFEPGTRYKALLGGSATGTKYGLLNSAEATKRAHAGLGYEAEASSVVTHTPYKMARDLWNLDEYRIENLVRHGVTNREVQSLHEKAKWALDEAEEATRDGRFDDGVMHSREAWAFEAKAYPKIRGTTADMLRGVLFYLFLTLPFAYFMERLLFGFADINKQLLGFFGIFLLVFLLLALVHPAFGVTNSSPVVLLAFVSIALSLLVLGMIRSRFELELSRFQQRPGASAQAKADFSRIAAAKSAFILGINNMRRRKMRTGLTLLTLITLTFSVLSFTSMEPESFILEHEIVNLEPGRGEEEEGALKPPLRLGGEGIERTEAGGLRSTGSIRVRDWLAVEAEYGEEGPARLELRDADGDACVVEFRPGSGYAAYALSAGGDSFLRSTWGILTLVSLAAGVVLLFVGRETRPYAAGGFAAAAVFLLVHLMPKGSAAGGIAPAELEPLGGDAPHVWTVRFNPETRECMAITDDRLVRRFRASFLDPPLYVEAEPAGASLAVDEERRGIPWKGFLVRQGGWGSMTAQALGYVLDEFDPAEGNLVAPRAWWLLSQTEATATAVTSAREPGLSFVAQGLVGMTAEEVYFTRPQEDLVAGRWFEPGEERVCVLPQKIANACGIKPEDLDKSPAVLILGEEMRVVGITNDDLWSNKTDIDTEQVSPVDYTVENWMKHSGRRRSESEFYHYTHLSPLNTAFVPYSFLISRGGTLRSIAVKPKGGMTKELKRKLLEKLSLPLFIADETKVKYTSAAGARPIRGVVGLLIPMLICGLIVLNTMLSAVYEREREISIYGTLGLTPVHIGSLFIAESLLFAVLGTVTGYVLGQVVAKFVAMGWFLEGLSLNYSSSSAVFSAVFVMGVVLLSTLYPAYRASQLSVPDVERIWKFPAPEGDVLRIDFPFAMGEEQTFGVSMHLKKFFEEHADQSVGEFYTSGARLEAREDGGVKVQCRAWIAPFDFGISQQVTLEMYPSEDEGMYEARMVLRRQSGEPGSWARMNHRFLGNVRKQFLVWRLFTSEERIQYLEETRKELARG